MAEVTEKMLTSAAQAGDLQQLQEWGQQGVCVATGAPLTAAILRDFVAVIQCLVQELGADVDQVTVPDGVRRKQLGVCHVRGATPLLIAAEGDHVGVVQCLIELGADVNKALPRDGWWGGSTPLIMAAMRGNLAVVSCLVQCGASVGAVDSDGNTALLVSATGEPTSYFDSLTLPHFSIMQYLVEHGGANMDDVSKDDSDGEGNSVAEGDGDRGKNAWDLLIEFLEGDQYDHDMEVDFGIDTAALSALLRVLVLRGAPPSALVALLPPEPAHVVQQGARLRAGLPSYLVQSRALLDAHCSVVLPPLLALVHGYMELTTTEELWETGLGGQAFLPPLPLRDQTSVQVVWV
jgi:hypothetical protein